MVLTKITSVTAEPDFRLRLVFDDGEVRRVGFRDIIERGGVFARLRDAEFFEQARIGAQGRSVVWPGEIDFCADALRQAGDPVAYGHTADESRK